MKKLVLVVMVGGCGTPEEALDHVASAIASPSASASATATATPWIERVSVSSAEAEANDHSYESSVSHDGRFVAFRSLARNLGTGTYVDSQIFVRDRLLGTTIHASFGMLGRPCYGDCDAPALSANGRFVAFHSSDRLLVPNDTNDASDVFVRDLQTGTLELVSAGKTTASWRPSISGDGRLIAFASPSSNDGLFVRDRSAGTTRSLGAGSFPALSADGRFVAFNGLAYWYAPGGVGPEDVYVRSLATGAIEKISVALGGGIGDQDSGDWFGAPSISADGRYVAFTSEATNLVSGDTNARADIFVRDRVARVTRRVSVSSSGAQANGASSSPRISADGRFVVFSSDATNLAGADVNGQSDVFVHDLLMRRTLRASAPAGGDRLDGTIYRASILPAISGDGRWIAFASDATNFVPFDTNGDRDVFLTRNVLAP